MSRQHKPQTPRRLFRNRERTGVVASSVAGAEPSDVDRILRDGEALLQEGRLAEAEACLRRVVAIAGERTPARGAAHAWLGWLAADRGDLEGALDGYRVASQHQPDESGIRADHGFILNRLGRFEEAASELREAIRLDPGLPTAHFNLGISLLGQGDFERGWAEYEWRLRMDLPWIHYRTTEFPRWDGEPLAGRTILLHTEQGIGDTIQFIRFAPLVKARAGRVLLAFPPEMAPLSGLLHWAVHCTVRSRRRPAGTPRRTECAMGRACFPDESAVHSRHDPEHDPASPLHRSRAGARRALATGHGVHRGVQGGYCLAWRRGPSRRPLSLLPLG